MLVEALELFGLSGGLAVAVEYGVTALAIWKLVDVLQTVIIKKK